MKGLIVTRRDAVAVEAWASQRSLLDIYKPEDEEVMTISIDSRMNIRRNCIVH